MRRACLVLGGIAAVAAAADLAHKARADTSAVHPRAAAYIVIAVALVLIWAAAIVLTRSTPIAATGGIAAGGAGANAVSAALWGAVPNPIVVDAVAFNLADVFVVGGVVMTALATLVFATTQRERLREPVRFG